MSEWFWVGWGFITAYGSILGYFGVLHLRRARLRREAERPR